MPNHVLIRLIRLVSRFTVHFYNAIYFLTIFNTLYKRFIKFLYFAFTGFKQGGLKTRARGRAEQRLQTRLLNRAAQITTGGVRAAWAWACLLSPSLRLPRQAGAFVWLGAAIERLGSRLIKRGRASTPPSFTRPSNVRSWSTTQHGTHVAWYSSLSSSFMGQIEYNFCRHEKKTTNWLAVVSSTNYYCKRDCQRHSAGSQIGQACDQRQNRKTVPFILIYTPSVFFIWHRWLFSSTLTNII